MLSTDQRWNFFFYYKSNDPEYHFTATFLSFRSILQRNVNSWNATLNKDQGKKLVGYQNPCYVNFDHALFCRNMHNTYIIPEDR